MASRSILAAMMLAAALVAAAGAALGQSSQRLTGLRLTGNQPIQIESDRLEIFDKDRKAVFSGNVSVTQGDTQVKAGRMTVHYSSDGGPVAGGGAAIERLEADGTVYVRSRNQVATGDRGTFDMRSEVLVMTGEKVVLSEGDNVIVGCKLTVEMRSGQARFEGCGDRSSESGRIIMQLTPGQK
jgi:lipopolysaccharide export system protein LptA